MKNVMKLIHRQPDLTSWSIREIFDKEWQLYWSVEQCEAERYFEEHYYDTRLFLTNRTDAEVAGQGRVRFRHREPESEVICKFDKGVEQARRCIKRAWPLPVRIEALTPVESCDPEVIAHPRETLHETMAQIWAGLTLTPRVKLSHCEMYIRDRTVQLTTSTGFEGSFQESFFTLYLVALGVNAHNTIDVKVERFRRSPKDLDWNQLTADTARNAIDSLPAKLPTSGAKVVVLCDDVLDSLFDPFIAHANGKLHYQGMSRFSPSTSIIQPCHGDHLTLTSDGLMPRGNETRAFDEDGVPAQKLTVVEQGTFQRPVCSQEYAHFLGLPATGPFTNKVVAVGNHTRAELLASAPEVLQVVSFSSFIPDPYTGSFVGEIRLGYEWRGSEARPVKGGAVSGNLFEAFQQVYFGSNQVFRGDYLGPDTVRLENLTVAGA